MEHDDFKYMFPKISNVHHRWNMFRKLELMLGGGLKVTGGGDTPTKTYLMFNRELTQQDLDAISVLFQDADKPAEPGYPDQFPGDRVKIKDLLEWMDDLKRQTGLNCAYWIEQSVIGSNDFDLLGLHFDKELTEPERHEVEKWYQSLFEWR